MYNVGEETHVVLEPFFGLGATRVMMTIAQSGQSFRIHGWDTDVRFQHYYEVVSTHTSEPMVLRDLNLGPISGDMWIVDPAVLPNAKGLVGGAPCQAFAPIGRKLGSLDPRAECYNRFTEWIVNMALRGVLLWFAVECAETVPASDQGKNALASLRESLPFFVIEFSKLTHDAGQIRPRSWFRGLRRDCLPTLPSPIPPARIAEPGEHIDFFDLLDLSYRNLSSVNKLTEPRKINLRAHMKFIAEHKRRLGSKVASFDIDRNIDRVFNIQVSFDACIGLRCKGPEIFIVSTVDMFVPETDPPELLPEDQWPKKMMFRFLQDRERFRLQGHASVCDTIDADDLGSRNFRLHATGNAFGTYMLERAVSPLFAAISSSCRL